MARGLTPVRDATSGFFLIRRDLAQGVRISAGGFKICLELLVRGRPAIRRRSARTSSRGATAGESKMNRKEALGYLRQLRELRRFVRARRRCSSATAGFERARGQRALATSRRRPQASRAARQRGAA